MTRFLLSPSAQADIEDIWDYSAARWGERQAETYVRAIHAAMAAACADPRLGRACDEIRRGYRRHLVGSHVIFYRQRTDHIEIVRILHQRMDFGRHL